MRRLYADILVLMKHNAWHRKGVRINDLTIPQIFNHLHDEVSELYQVLTNPPEYTLRKEGKAAGDYMATDDSGLTKIFAMDGSPTAQALMALNDIRLHELGDILAIVYHVMARNRWDPALVEYAACEKLAQRWKIDGPAK